MNMRGGASSTRNYLRGLFPDTTSVVIYGPEDFNNNTTGNTTDILFTDLLDRHQGHFSNRRLAVLFLPGTYHDVNFPVGYWTQVLGLGETPDQVKFTGRFGPYALPANTEDTNVGSLDTFWRAAENFYTDTTFVQDTTKNGNPWSIPLNPGNASSPMYPVNMVVNEPNTFDASRGMLWACSQAAPLRRIKVANNLHLSLGAYRASGGFVGNMDIGGYLLLGSQQQFCIRNCNIQQKVNPGAWSTVLVGNKYQGDLPMFVPEPKENQCVTVEPRARVRIEKPFIFVDGLGQLYLGIPKVQKDSVGIGTQHSELSADEKVLIDNAKYVKVFGPQDSYKDVQKAATNGVHIILSPGTYNWGTTLKITRDNQVVLGLGMATIQAPTDGSPCISVASGVGGVRISGLALEASVLQTNKYTGSTLLQWGDPGKTDPGDSENPGALHDLYCFVGGRNPSREVQVECMVRLYSGNIAGDNLWLWRADHVALDADEEPNKPKLSEEYHLTTYGECKCDTALEVFGDNVIFHGLAAEHTYADNVVWHGQNGTVIFYQNELPYDVSGSNFVEYAGYLVRESAHGHTAKGVGVYNYFRDFDNVTVSPAVRHLPEAPGLYENVFAVWLNGFRGIQSVINGQGGPASIQGHPVIVRKPDL
jgi:hypothetical protein